MRWSVLVLLMSGGGSWAFHWGISGNVMLLVLLAVLLEDMDVPTKAGGGGKPVVVVADETEGVDSASTATSAARQNAMATLTNRTIVDALK